MSQFYGSRDDRESVATIHRALDLGVIQPSSPMKFLPRPSFPCVPVAMIGACLFLAVVGPPAPAGPLVDHLRRVAEDARLKTAQADMQALTACLEMFKLNAGFYPSTAQGLDACANRPTVEPVPRRWVQLIDKVPQDPWGNPYQYRYPGKKDPARFDLFSLGKDGVANTADDIQVPKAAAGKAKE
jgi:general secretion pathway protein G